MKDSGKDYDLVVIGSGIASTPARKCAAAGWKVALVDNRPPGGTCALRGCSPKKMMRSGVEALDWLERMEGRGVRAGAARGDWAGIIDHAKGYTEPIPEANKRAFEKQGVEFIAAHARFVGPNELALRDESGAERVVGAAHIVLATGARPTPLRIDGAGHLMGSDEFFELRDLPRRVTFVGGGFISMEFAHMTARHGAETTVIHSHERPLGPFDPDLVDMLVKVSEQQGIRFQLDTRVERITASGAGFVVHGKTTQGEPVRIETDLVVHGAGRVPNIDGLGLDAGNVASTRAGITVNEFLQSPTNPSVFAAGDCCDCGAPQLSFTASATALAVSHNLLHGNSQSVDFSGQASVAFTLPAIARAGMTEEEARAACADLLVKHEDTTRWFTNRRAAEHAGAYKLLIDKEKDRILGAHLLAHHCEEFINVFAMAIRHGLTRGQLRQVLWAHPSSASDLNRMMF